MPWTVAPSLAFSIFRVEETEGADKIQNIEESRFVIMEGGIKHAPKLQQYSIDCREAILRKDPTSASRLILDIPIAADYPYPGPTSYAISSIQETKWKGKDDITKKCYKPVKPYKYFKMTVIASVYDDYNNFIIKKHPTPYKTEGRTSLYRGKKGITGEFIVAQEIIEPSAKPGGAMLRSPRNKTTKTAKPAKPVAMQAKKKA
jgi:hypothetical protein